MTNVDELRIKLNEELKGSKIMIANEKNCIPYAANVAKLALNRIANHDIDDSATLLPNYSHMPNVMEYKKKN